MLMIDYLPENKKFSVDIKLDQYSRDDFQTYVEFLKSIHVYWNKEKHLWLFDEKRIDEIVTWLEKRKMKATLTSEANEVYDTFVNNRSVSETKFFRNKKLDESILSSHTKLFEYQKKGIEWRLQRSSYLDADDAGLGKTLSNAFVMTTLFKEGSIDGAVICVLNGLSFHWKYEILDKLNYFKEEDIHIITNKNKKKPFEKLKDKKVLIVPIHLVSDVLKSYHKDEKEIKSTKNVKWEKLVNIKKEWEKKSILTMVDESHSIKHSTALRSKAITSLKMYSDYRICASATPAINRIEDFYNQFYFLDKSIINLSENCFKLWISNEIGSIWNQYDIISYNSAHVKEFYSVIQPYCIKRLKEDIPEMKVKKVVSTIALEMTDHQKDLYDYICREQIDIIKGEFDKVTLKTVLNKLPIITEVIDNPQLLLNREYANNEAVSLISKCKLKDDPKYIILKSLLEKYIEHMEEKVVVYGIHPETLDLLEKEFEKYKPLIIHGKKNTKEEERHYIQETFNKKKENKLILLSALTSSAGINLQEGSNHIIIYECPFDATLVRQLMDRTHRITSKKDSTIEILYYPESIDNIRVNRALNRVELNDKLGKSVSDSELDNLLRGIV